MTTRSKTIFKKAPMCELLYDKPAEFFVYRGDFKPRPKTRAEETPEELQITFLSVSQVKSYPSPLPVGNSIFVSREAPEGMTDYGLEIWDFFKSPASTVDWLAHLSEKAWFDADDFFAMIYRFRKATDSYGAL
jgi:hypothetical protein